MSSKSGNTAKLLVGVTAFITAVAGILTATLGTGGIPALIEAINGSSKTNPQPTTSPSPSTTEISKPNPSATETVKPSNPGDNDQPGSGIIQRSGNGDCNPNVATGQGATITIICTPKSNNSFGNIPSFGNVPSLERSTSNVQLQTTVTGLQRGSNKFTLLLTNSTPDQSVDISTRRLDISDDSDNTYELDSLAMHGTGLSKTVPPQGRIKINYILSSPISNEATSVTFTLNNVWAQPRGSKFSSNLPQIQWTTKL
ncbi:MAG: hypothetical protein KME21_05465 [Desmonostoc vinosum HA7617-LM4]|jgi:hypothetical protein|nr:hypothetical protein [Desmonostoc vinosum HA7617-LM4]